MWFEFYKFLSGALIITGGYFLGCTIVSVWFYKEQKQIAAEITEEEKLEQSIEEFVGKYLEEYKVTERELLDEKIIKSLKNLTITEETPLGIVKMYYSHEDESFIYWSEKQVPYKVLESVSRKYVIDNNCKCIHYDMDEEIASKRQEILDTNHVQSDTNHVQSDTTNTKSDRTNTKSETEHETKTETKTETEPNSVFVTFKKNKTVEKKKPLLCDNANRYSYRGKYEAPVMTKEAKVINFAEYLKMRTQMGTYTLNGEMCNTREELQTKVKELIQDERDRECILECELDNRTTPSTDDLTAYEEKQVQEEQTQEEQTQENQTQENQAKDAGWLW